MLIERSYHLRTKNSSEVLVGHNTKCMPLENFFLLKLIIGNRENVYLPEKSHYKRFSTIFEMGFRGTYKDDYVKPHIPFDFTGAIYLIKQMLFCNLLICS